MIFTAGYNTSTNQQAVHSQLQTLSLSLNELNIGSVLFLLVSVTLECDNLLQLCPHSSPLRICTCTSTGSAVRWRTNLNGVFNDTGSVILPLNSTMHTAKEFTVLLDNYTPDNITSVLTYTYSFEQPDGVIDISCDDPSVPGTTQTVNSTVKQTGKYIS